MVVPSQQQYCGLRPFYGESVLAGNGRLNPQPIAGLHRRWGGVAESPPG